MLQHADRVYRGNITDVRGKNKNKLQRKAVTKSREKEYDVDSHRDLFLRHMCVLNLAFWKITYELYIFIAIFLSFFSLVQSRLGLCNSKSLLYKSMEMNILKISDAHCLWCPLLNHLKKTKTTFPIN